MVNDASSGRTTEKGSITRSKTETLSKEAIKTSSTSTINNRKSELLQKRTPPALGSKSENSKKLKMTPSPLRRSERNRNPSSSPSSNPSPSNSGSAGLKKQVVGKQLAFEPNDVERNSGKGSSKLIVKKLDARAYRKTFKTQNRDYHEESSSLDRSTSEDGSRCKGKIDECSKANSLHCKAIPKDVTLRPEDAKAKDICAESRLRKPEKELSENDAALDSTVPSNATTHETSGAPERVQPDFHGKETPQVLASRNSSNENLIRKCVGHDNVENMTSSKRKSTLVDKCSDIAATLVDDDNNDVIVDAGPSKLCCNNVETSGPCSKRIRGVSLSGEQRDQRQFINDIDQTCSKFNDEKSSDRDKEERPQGINVETEKIRKEQRSLHLSLKPEIAKLCEILCLPGNVKSVVEKFLEYTISNYQICTEPVSILQAFQLSLCWTAASLLRHKLDFEASLMLAKRHLNFDCKKDVVNEIKAMLWDLKDKFLLLTGNSEVIQKASETSDTVHSKTEVIPNVELTKKDNSKNIKETQKRKNQWRKLLQLQKDHRRRLEKNIETEKGDFVRRSSIESTVIGKDKLLVFNIECVKRTKELERKHEILLKDLEAKQLEARQKLQESWALDESLTNELGTPHNAPIVLLPDHVTEGKTDSKDESMTRNGIRDGFSEAPNSNSSVVALCSSPDRLVSGNKCHNIAENEYDSQGNIISKHSNSGDQCSDGAISTAVVGEGCKNFSRESHDDREICDGGTSSVPNAEVAPAVHKAIISNDDSSRQGKLDRTILSEPVCALSVEAKVNGSIDGVKNMASSNSQSPEECMPSVSTTCRLYCKDAAQIHEADGRNASNNASTLNSPLSDENLESSQEHVTCMPKVQISAQVHEVDDGIGSNDVVTLKLPLNHGKSGDGNVLDRDREVHAEMPRTANITPLSMQPLSPVESMPSIADILPANQTNFSMVMEPPDQVQQLPSSGVLSSNRDLSNLHLVTRTEDQAANNEDALRSQISEASTKVPVEVPRTANITPLSVQPLPPVELQPSSADMLSANQTNETALTSQIPEVQNHPVEQPPSSLDVDSHSRRVVVPPASNMDLDSLMPGGVRAQSSDTRNLSIPRVSNNHSIQTAAQSASRFVPSLCHDPLSHEMERILKRTEQHKKNHDDMKLQMKCDFDHEFKELCRKYEMKYKELEGEFHEVRKNQETILKFVYAHKMLADALMAKYPIVYGTSNSVMQQDAGFPQQLPRQQNASRPSLVATTSPREPPAASLQSSNAANGSATPSLRGPPAANLQNAVRPPGMQAATGSQTMVRPPPMQATYNTSGVFSSVSARLPHINSTSSPSGNLQAGGELRAPAPHLQPYRPITPVPASSINTASNEIRAPAPHLQPYRPPASVPVSSINTAPNGMPSRIAHGNIPASSLPFSQWPPQTMPTTSQSDIHRGRWHENRGGLSTPNMSAVELRGNVNSQSSINLPNALPRKPDLASLNPSNSGPSSTPANSAHETTPPNVVCLSDDE